MKLNACFISSLAVLSLGTAQIVQADSQTYRNSSSTNRHDDDRNYQKDNHGYSRDDQHKDSEHRDFAQDRGSTQNDKQLNDRIRDKVSRGWLYDSYKDVILKTDNGYVVLEGLVETKKEENDLLHAVQKIDGVKGVTSNLRVRDNSNNKGY